tara:strand:+ start:153 stop:323 length:171 start_codon:yes stop_codon:yes gene_type:complete
MEIKIAVRKKTIACIRDEKKFQHATKALADLSDSLLTELISDPIGFFEKKPQFAEK